jgi:tetratricopeptide (TPR) repeat protein
LTVLRRGDEAMVALNRAVKIFERPDANQPLLIAMISVRGDAEAELGRSADARADYQRSIELTVASLGHDTEEVAESYEALADLDANLGRHREALAESREALAISDKVDQPGGPNRARALAVVGEAELALGDARAAVAPLRAAVDALAKSDSDAVTVADLRSSLARAIWDSRGDRSEAHSLAAAAETPFAGSPTKLATLHAWPRAHP